MEKIEFFGAIDSNHHYKQCNYIVQAVIDGIWSDTKWHAIGIQEAYMKAARFQRDAAHWMRGDQDRRTRIVRNKPR